MEKRRFTELGLSAEMLKAVDKMGFEEASPIQTAVIPVAMSGRDVVGLSSTGSGKTAAFGIPAIESVDPRVRGVQALGQGVAGVLLLGLAWRWSRLPSLRQRLPAMLLRGFIWLGVALLLSALAQPAAALHAYALGFLGTLLLAMASRVTCGQAGRAVVADDLLWLLFRLQQFAVLARVAAALWPLSAPWLLPLAATAWAGVALGWLLRYGRWLGQPKAAPRRG